jgi:hypothetical protein
MKPSPFWVKEMRACDLNLGIMPAQYIGGANNLTITLITASDKSQRK